MNGHNSEENTGIICIGNSIISSVDYFPHGKRNENHLRVFEKNIRVYFENYGLQFTCSILYNEMAIKPTFGGSRQKITPEFMVATKLKILR